MTDQELLASIKAKLGLYSNGLTSPMISALLAAPVERVRRLMKVGLAREEFATSIHEGKTMWHIAGREPYAGVLTPHNMVNKMLGTYDGAELRPLPGLTSDRFDAYRLPSRMGSLRIWRDGRTEHVEEA